MKKPKEIVDIEIKWNNFMRIVSRKPTNLQFVGG